MSTSGEVMEKTKRVKVAVAVGWGAALLLGVSTRAVAEEKKGPPPTAAASVAATLAKEPPVAEVVAEALRYFRLHPEAVDAVRSAAHTRALLPLVAGGFRYDDDKFVRFEEQSPTPVQNNENTNRHTNSYSVGAVWDLRELVFNPAEVQVYGLVGIQRDLMLEVTRTYFLRKQLLLLRTQKPPEDAVTAATLDLRVEEYTAVLDVLTGGWFSRARGTASARE